MSAEFSWKLGQQRVGRPRSYVSWQYIDLGAEAVAGRDRGTVPPEALPLSPLCQAVAQTMDSVFKELLGKTAARQGLGPAAANSPSSGPRSPKPPGYSRLGKNKAS